MKKPPHSTEEKPTVEKPLDANDMSALKSDMANARRNGPGPGRHDIKALVTRVGGADVVYTVLEDFYDRMSKDLMLGYFFDGRDVKLTARRQAEFILNAAGYLTRYSGRGPSTAHLEMPPIYEGHFDRRLQILRETLTQHKLTAENVDEWVRFEENFREMVVTKEKA
jgi:truncated hemoglobin YjbI